ETQGRTPFGGVELTLVARLALRTTIGQLALAGIACFVLTASAIRTRSPSRWRLATVLSAGAVWRTALASHAAAQPGGRSPAVAAQLAHLTAGAVWLGVLGHLLTARPVIVAHPQPPCLALISEIVRRFSPVALAAASVLLVSGAYGTVRTLP